MVVFAREETAGGFHTELQVDGMEVSEGLMWG